MHVFQRISCLILFLLLYPIILLNLECTQQQNHRASELEGAAEIIKRFPFILLKRGLIKNATKEKWAEWCKVTLIELVTERGRNFSLIKRVST